MKCKFFLLFLMLLLFPFCGKCGIIEGTLVDTLGVPIENCRINLFSPTNNINKIVKTNNKGKFEFKVSKLKSGSRLLVVVDDINVICNSRILVKESYVCNPLLSDLYKAMSVVYWDSSNDTCSNLKSVLNKLENVKVSNSNMKYGNQLLALFLNGRYVTDVKIESSVWYKDFQPKTSPYPIINRWSERTKESLSFQRLHGDCTTAGYRPAFEKGATEIKEESVLGDFNAYEYISKIPMSDIQMISIIRKGDNRLDFERNSFGASTIAVNVNGFDRPLFDDEKSGLAIITVK